MAERLLFDFLTGGNATKAAGEDSTLLQQSNTGSENYMLFAEQRFSDLVTVT